MMPGRAEADMRERGVTTSGVWRRLCCVVALSMLAFGCSTPEREAAPSPAAGQDASEGCAVGADRIVERLEGFLAELPEQTPDEFLSQDEVPGLAVFQDDVATVIAETTDQRSTLCNLDGLQTLIAERLTEVETEGALDTFLVATVLRGGELETADVRVGPEDDIEAVLGLLDDGSSITFEAGTYDFVRPLIVQRDIAVLGSGQGSTTIRSSATDAAFVVVGRGVLRMREVTVEHTGAEQASVVVAFGRPVDLRSTTLRGGVSDGAGAGGNGLVLTDEVFGGGERDPDQPGSVVSDSTLTGNEGAGMVVEGALVSSLLDSTVSDNEICGVCLFSEADATIERSVLANNAFGIQVGDDARLLASANDVTSNTIGGIVVVGRATADVVDNAVADNLEVGIVVQENASANVARNTLGAQPFGLSILTTGVVTAVDNAIDGPDVGIQVDEVATPSVMRNTVLNTAAVGIAHAGSSAGTFVDNVVRITEGVGAVAEASATPDVRGFSVEGGEVGFAYAGSAGGVLGDSQFAGQGIGLQLDESAAPTIERVSVESVTDAGLVARGSAAPQVESIEIVAFGEVAIAAADTASPTVVNATIRDGVNGVSFIGSSDAVLESSRFESVEVGIQVGEAAAPQLLDNDIVAPRSVGIVFVDEATGEVRRNRITDPVVVGIQLGGDSGPIVEGNVLFFTRPEGAEPIGATATDESGLDGADAATSDPEQDGAEEGGVDAAGVEEGSVEGDGGTDGADASEGGSGGAFDSVVGMLYAEQSAGVARGNQVIGFVIGFQVGDGAAPELVDNVIDGGVWLGVGILYRDDASGRAEMNATANHGVALQVSDRSSPTLLANEIDRVRDVAILVQGVATPRLEKNICPEGVAGIGLLDDAAPELIDNACVEVTG